MSFTEMSRCHMDISDVNLHIKPDVAYYYLIPGLIMAGVPLHATIINGTYHQDLEGIQIIIS